MRSTFMGLETARRGMFTQQSALYTTGHNIANANTPGYSRQRVNFQNTLPYPSIGLNSPVMPGQLGTGVEAGSVQRIRDAFLDTQYRNENSKVGYYGTLSDSLSKMEGVLNEPSETGLHSAMDKFWGSLQDLANYTENSGARDVVAARGEMVADTLNYYYNSLTRVQDDLGYQIEVRQTDINSHIDSIAQINKQISEIEPSGYLPNDLYDRRDQLVDELSKLISIKVTKVKPDEYGNAKDIAEGLYNIEVVQADGKSYNPPITLIQVDPSNGLQQTNKVIVDFENNTDPKGAVTGVKLDNGQSIPNYNFRGELIGLIESYGYLDGTDIKGSYPDMLEKLNGLTEAFVNEFNAIHKDGYALGATSKSTDDFFTFDSSILDTTKGNYAQAITVNRVIKENPGLIAAGKDSGASGDNKNAQALADLKTLNFDKYGTFSGNTSLTGNLDTYYSGIIGKLGVDSQSAARNTENSLILADNVEVNRQSVSAVSLDEEMSNMIKFQHAYNASARNITVIDEMLDRIINGMGVVGR